MIMVVMMWFVDGVMVVECENVFLCISIVLFVCFQVKNLTGDLLRTGDKGRIRFRCGSGEVPAECFSALNKYP